MSASIVSTSVQTIDPRMAQEWLESVNYEKQRPLSRRHVDFYAKEMQRGAWKPTNTIAVAHVNGHMALVNGQHTLAAIAASGVPQKQPVTRYQCDTEKDVAELYAHFDKGKGRNYVDTLRAYDFPKQVELSTYAVQKLTAAVMVIVSEFSTGRGAAPLMSDVDRMDVVVEWVGIYNRLDAVLSGCNSTVRKKIVARACLPVALVTMKHAPSVACDFWRGAAHLDGLTKNDPRGTLHRFLISSRHQSGTQAEGWQTDDSWRGVAHAWNKYYRGASLGRMSSIKQLRSMYPQIVIEGTPYTG